VRLARTAAALALGVLASAALWYALGREQQVPGGLAPGQRMQCASYTPIRGEETPAAFTVTRERLEQDFALLSEHVGCVRIYSMKGMELVPEFARAHGLRLVAGAWVNREQADTEREIAALIAMANANPDVIDSVLVGNEVLLRRELGAAQLTTLIRRVRAAVAQPVSYGDVWEFWLHNAQLGAEVDFVTIHLLPYWENDPTGIDGAIEAVAKAHAAIAGEFPGKPILIGETGWPSEGRRREDAQPGRVNQARFVRGFLARAEQEGWRYNLIEAFDQPWKRAQEGAVGGYWGLFDDARRDKGALAGAVSDLPAWRTWLLGSLGLWALFAFAGRSADAAALLVQAATANGVALHLHRMTLYSRDTGESAWCLLLAVAALACAWLWTAARRGSAPPRWRDAAVLLLAALAAVEMLGLAFDPRYRDFPVALFAAPALVAARLGLRGPSWRERGRAMGMVLLACIPAVLWQEGVVNPVALAWVALCGVLGAALLRGFQGQRGSSPRSASASSAITAAGAPRAGL
jgi:exo-beta-1,3-glucanase (GH17 family)